MQNGERHEFGWRSKGGHSLRLGDYLEFAREHSISAELELRFGVIELGRVLLVNGELRHAELPGSSGEKALSLLSGLSRIEVEVRSLTSDRPTTFRGDWRKSVHTPPLTRWAREALSSTFAEHIISAAPPMKIGPPPPWGISALRGRGRAPQETPLPPLISPKVPPKIPPAKAVPKADFDELFIQAMQAYRRREHRAALDLFDQCADLRPGESRVEHNRLRLRKRLGMP